MTRLLRDDKTGFAAKKHKRMLILDARRASTKCGSFSFSPTSSDYERYDVVHLRTDTKDLTVDLRINYYEREHPDATTLDFKLHETQRRSQRWAARTGAQTTETPASLTSKQHRGKSGSVAVLQVKEH